MILTNDFHNTRVQVNLAGRYFLTQYQVRRSWKRLCGIQGCTCGDIAGTRGPQWLDGTVVLLQPCADNSMNIIVP